MYMSPARLWLLSSWFEQAFACFLTMLYCKSVSPMNDSQPTLQKGGGTSSSHSIAISTVIKQLFLP